jgi:hypothetical protein
MKTFLTRDRVISIIVGIVAIAIIVAACWLYSWMPDDLSRATLVFLTYFKPNGKYYTSSEYESNYVNNFEIYEQVDKMIRKGINPGLVDGAVIRNEFAVLVQPKDGVPHLFTTFKAK